MGSTATTEPASSAADASLPEGAEVGEYRVETAIGKGGFGSVYRAVHPLIGKQVAIKVLAHRYSADPAIVSRFQAEAKAVNQISHRNIIDIFSFGQLPDGRSYYVMELLDGEPLDRVIERGPIALASALPILRALARALDAAHAKGIAHRDLKPENVFLARDPDGATYPKLLDFGIAKLLAPEEDVRHHTGTGVPIGTPTYMSPEQCRGRDVDHRTDIYSFGVMTYRVLTGEYPFAGDFMELMMKHMGDEPVPPSQHVPSLPATVDAAVAWMMSKDREQRPPTLVAAVAALDPGAPVTGARAARPSVAPRDRAAFAATMMPEHKRSRAPWLVALGLVLAAAGGLAWYFTRPDAPVPVPAAVVAAPVAVPAAVPVAVPAAVPVPVPVPAAVAIPTAVAAKPTQHVKPARPTLLPKAPPSDDDRGAIIHLSHDSFTK